MVISAKIFKRGVTKNGENKPALSSMVGEALCGIGSSSEKRDYIEWFNRRQSVNDWSDADEDNEREVGTKSKSLMTQANWLPKKIFTFLKQRLAQRMEAVTIWIKWRVVWTVTGIGENYTFILHGEKSFVVGNQNSVVMTAEDRRNENQQAAGFSRTSVECGRQANAMRRKVLVLSRAAWSFLWFSGVCESTIGQCLWWGIAVNAFIIVALSNAIVTEPIQWRR